MHIGTYLLPITVTNIWYLTVLLKSKQCLISNISIFMNFIAEMNLFSVTHKVLLRVFGPETRGILAYNLITPVLTRITFLRNTFYLLLTTKSPEFQNGFEVII